MAQMFKKKAFNGLDDLCDTIQPTFCDIFIPKLNGSVRSNVPSMCNFKSGRETRPLIGIKRGQSDAAFYRISKSLVEWFRT